MEETIMKSNFHFSKLHVYVGEILLMTVWELTMLSRSTVCSMVHSTLFIPECVRRRQPPKDIISACLLP